MLNMLPLCVLCLLPFVASTAPNLMAVLSQQNVTIMIDLIEAAGLAEYVAMQGPMTLIAPTDEAFRSQPADYIDHIKADKDRVKNYVRYHLIHGDIFSWDISRSTNIQSQNGHILRFYFQSKRYGDVPSLRVNAANVVKHDIQANNGVIQLVDNVLNVPEGTVEEVLLRDGNLTTISNITFISHLNYRLNRTRAGHRQTVFAPTDEAFKRMDQVVLMKILQHTNYAKELMNYHIHPGTLTLDQIKSRHTTFISTNLFLDDIHISKSNGEVLLNRLTRITRANIECDNGLVHIIDRVLIPPSLQHLG